MKDNTKKGVYLVQIISTQWTYVYIRDEYYFVFGCEEPREVLDLITIGKYCGNVVISDSDYKTLCKAETDNANCAEYENRR